MVFAKKSDGIFLVAMQTEYGIEKEQPKIPIIKKPINEGVIFDSDRTNSRKHTKIVIEETNAIIAVPYGQFRDCVRIREITKRSFGDGE